MQYVVLKRSASSDVEPSSPTKSVATGGRVSLFKALYDTLPLNYLPRIRPRARRRDSEGILAPRSPTISVPPSPGLGPVHPMNGMSSPLLSPRRSGEAFPRPSSPSNFTLNPPPKRSGVLDDSVGSRKVEMRRTPSSSSTIGDGWRKIE